MKHISLKVNQKHYITTKSLQNILQIFIVTNCKAGDGDTLAAMLALANSLLGGMVTARKYQIFDILLDFSCQTSLSLPSPVLLLLVALSCSGLG